VHPTAESVDERSLSPLGNLANPLASLESYKKEFTNECTGNLVAILDSAAAAKLTTELGFASTVVTDIDCIALHIGLRPNSNTYSNRFAGGYCSTVGYTANLENTTILAVAGHRGHCQSDNLTPKYLHAVQVGDELHGFQVEFKLQWYQSELDLLRGAH
jgi:hypothetical protein